ncbi:unnamed protein product [marine sediment metagenome]|uniref:Uncharacterized protein n=1 Tax=marine sediment metagenome TaxID=412755 RepID=X0ZBB8_9ZZZZ
MSKLDDQKKMLDIKEKEDRAVTFHNQLIVVRQTLFINAIKIGVIMKVIRDEKLYKIIIDDCVSFEAFCSFELPQIQIPVIKRYISAVDLLEKMGVEINVENKELDGYAVNKVLLLKNCRNPKEWLKPMAEMPFKDLQKEINEKELGIKPEDNEVVNYIKREKKKESECPFGDYKCGRKKDAEQS